VIAFLVLLFLLVCLALAVWVALSALILLTAVWLSYLLIKVIVISVFALMPRRDRSA
jgi:hypothetical protein